MTHRFFTLNSRIGILLMVVILTMAGCRKKDTAVRGTDVYVAGWSGFAGGNRVAKYWKNTVEVNLTDTASIKYAAANAIYVDGSDVYVAGEIVGATGVQRAVYWKNGIRYELTDGTYLAHATDIAVFRGDVYVSGFLSPAGNWQPKCWKNGSEVAVSTWSTNSSAYVYGIAVEGGDIYMAGYESSSRSNYAVYWKNGQPSAIDSTVGALNVSDLALSGSDIYLSGGATHSTNLNGYWKNGDASGLTLSNGVVKGIAVSGSDVYMGGYEGQVAKYWKNGTPVITGNSVQGYSSSLGIFLMDNDVYTSGYQLTGAVGSAGYWKNTTWFPCPSSAGVQHWGEDVFVVKQ